MKQPPKGKTTRNHRAMERSNTINCQRATATLVLTSALLLPISASAACVVCWAGGCATFADNSCNEVTSAYATCFTLGEMWSPDSDYILAQKGRAWLVQGEKSTPFASDAMTSALRKMNIKYGKTDNSNPKIKKETDAAWAAFFEKRNTGTVSNEVISRFSKMTGLSVRRE